MVNEFNKNFENAPGLFDGKFKYNNAFDAIYLLNNDNKLYEFLRFVMAEIRGYSLMYSAGQIDSTPVVYYVAAGSQKEFVSFDYMFFIQCMAKYMITLTNEADVNRFVSDFMVSNKNKKYKTNGVLLVHFLLETQYDIVYVNSMYRKIPYEFIGYATDTIYKNARTEIQYSSVNFKFKELGELMRDPTMMEALKKYAQLTAATQVAYGAVKCQEYWSKSQKIKKYFLTSESFSF